MPKPGEVLEGFLRAFDRPCDRILDGNGRSAGELDDLVDIVFHGAWTGPRAGLARRSA